ncbi:MAG TPA: plastocyanin/azurin family copper-binding protein [Thermoplasmata archaeon]|nr:plastocyanin/azurin family copper-binding protein [Thermoplasmata archaeon]
MDATSERGGGLRQKPFAILVMFAGLVYTGVALLAVMVEFGFFDPSILAFGALFLVAGFLVLWRKRWTPVVGLALSLLFLAFYIPIIGEIVSNPANSGFWLVITVVPLLGLVAVFAILSLWKWKQGLAHTPYLASPKSSGGLFTVAIIGFVLGGLLIGGLSGGTISRLLNGGVKSANIVIVPNAAQVTPAYSPPSFPARVGVPVTWFNQDPTTHTVTSLNGTELNSGNILSGVYFTHTFAQAGTYDYYCTIHPTMRGTVLVTPWP